MKTVSLLSPFPEPRTLFSDLVLELHNQRLTIYDIRLLMDDLYKYESWGFILPRITISAIRIPYILDEMNYDEMLSEPDSAQAVLIYRGWDAVMIKPGEPNVILQ